MNSKLALGARALAAGVLFGAIPAGATTIDIGLAEAPGIGNITTVATGSAAGVGWAGSYDKYAINAVLASDPDPIGLTSGTIDVKGPNATSAIYLYVTETGLTSSVSNLNLSSIFGISNLPTGWTLTETTYLDNSDAAYGEGTQLATTGTQSGSIAGSTQTDTTEASVSSVFSLTEVYELVSNGFSGIVGASETITDPPGGIQAAPAPAIGSGVPGMLAVGGVLLGWRLWERRRQT
jgi:hypothetical protein